MSIIEGRLKILEDEGYIYYEVNRWWLTRKGKELLENPDSPISSSASSPAKPIRTILEETFSKFESDVLKSKPTLNSHENVEEISKKRIQAEVLLSELKQSNAMGLISDEEFKELNERLHERFNEFEIPSDTYIQKRYNDLLKEIKEIEEILTKKKIELDKLSKIISEKRNI